MSVTLYMFVIFLLHLLHYCYKFVTKSLRKVSEDTANIKHMKIVRITMALFYFSTQAMFASSGLIQTQPSINPNSIKVPANVFSHLPNFLKTKTAQAEVDYKDVRMIYIAGKFAGASLEVDGVRYEVGLNEAGNGLLIYYREDSSEWIVGQGSISEEKNSVSLTLSFNRGAAFVVSYDYSKGEIVVSKSEENWNPISEGSIQGMQKEESTSSYLYDEKGELKNAYASGVTSIMDELGNLTVGFFKRDYFVLGGVAKVSGYQLFALTEKTMGLVTRVEVSKKYEMVNGVSTLVESSSQSKTDFPGDHSEESKKVPLFYSLEGGARLKSMMKDGIRASTSLLENAILSGQAVLTQAMLNQWAPHLEDSKSSKDGLIQYIYNSGGASATSKARGEVTV